MTALTDKWLRIVGVALLLAFSITGNGFHKQPVTGEVLIRILVSFVSITVTWHVIRAIIYYVRQRYNAKQKIAKRLLLTFVTGSLASTLIIWIMGAVRQLALYGTLANYRAGSR